MALTKLHFMDDPGYLTPLIQSGTKATSFGYFISFKEGVNKGMAYKKLMIQSVYKNREGVLRGNFKRGKVKLDNILLHPELVSDVVEAVSKVFEENFGINLVGQMDVKPMVTGGQADVRETVSPIPEKKDSLDDRLKRLGRVK